MRAKLPVRRRGIAEQVEIDAVGGDHYLAAIDAARDQVRPKPLTDHRHRIGLAGYVRFQRADQPVARAAFATSAVADSRILPESPDLVDQRQFAALCHPDRRQPVQRGRMGMQDVFVNIAGGLRVEDPGIDLGVIAAIVSSYHNVSVDSKIAFIGEVGLSGEVRAVSRIEQRIAEAEKLGFQTVFLSRFNKMSASNSKMNIVQVSKLEEFLGYLFG